jgi:hypothetical protein
MGVKYGLLFLGENMNSKHIQKKMVNEIFKPKAYSVENKALLND